MPDRKLVETLIARVERGGFDVALEEFYADTASMQENLDPPRQGLANLVAHERKVMASFPRITARCIAPVLIDGDTVVINWLFEFTRADGGTLRLDELARQRWEGDKVVEERFYYDPKQ